MRLIFAGTPDFAVPALQALHAAGHEIIAVYTQPDRPAGRGRKLAPSPVKQAALTLGLTLHQPASLKDQATQQMIANLAPDVMIVVAYGLILPQAVLDIPRHGCMNIHASLLPRWRGAAPIQRAIEAGDTCTGITIMQMEAGLDTGPILLKQETPITEHDHAGPLHDRLAQMGGVAIVEALEALSAGTLSPMAQDEAKSTYAAKLDKAEGLLDFTQPARILAQRIRAFDPWPGTRCVMNKTSLRILDATARPELRHDKTPGTILEANSKGIQVATAEGVLVITRLQAAGGKALAAADFLNGHQLSIGMRLGDE